MLLMIDNYDSFTYNLVQYFEELGEDVRVYRNNKITLDQIEALKPSRVVVSPGPCTPNEAGISVETLRHFAGRLPLLGVCLGHQSLAVAFGGEVVRAERLMHGKTSKIRHRSEEHTSELQSLRHLVCRLLLEKKKKKDKTKNT